MVPLLESGPKGVKTPLWGLIPGRLRQDQAFLRAQAGGPDKSNYWKVDEITKPGQGP